MIDGSAHQTMSASLVIRPNRSLSVAGVFALFVALSAVALTIGVSFTLAGAWLVLPFAALEILIVAVLCRWLYRHVDDCELVIVDVDRVRIIKRRGTRSLQYDFSRHWARVRFDEGSNLPASARLLIGSHGRFVSLADDINEVDRATVAQELKQLLRRPS